MTAGLCLGWGSQLLLIYFRLRFLKINMIFTLTFTKIEEKWSIGSAGWWASHRNCSFSTVSLMLCGLATQGLVLWVTFLWNCLDPSLGSHNWIGEGWSKKGASQVGLVVKSLPVNAGDVIDMGLIPGLGRFPGGGHGNPLQYSWLGNPTDKGAWWTTVHGVAKKWTHWSDLAGRQST